jgi:hypothetical protein
LPPVEEVSVESIPQSLRGPLLAKLTIDLPVDELNLSSLQSRVLLAVIEDEMDSIDADLTRATQAMEEVENRVRSVGRGTQNVSQTAEVVRAKAKLMDEWVDAAAVKSTAMRGAYLIEGLMWVFTLLATVLHLLWTRDYRQRG